MKSFLVKPNPFGIRGEIHLLGDKSIAHRSIILSAISQGQTVIENFPTNKDCLKTIEAFQKLGVRIRRNFSCANKNPLIKVFGKGLYGLNPPTNPVFVGDSGTTARLLLGVLAGQDFKVTLRGSKSLSARPMLRVTAPLRLMGAKINAQRRTHNLQREEYLPITIKGGNLKAIIYKMPIASAQVKSAMLLAGLYAKGETCVIEPIKTRDHTERILKLFKAEIKVKENKIVIKGKQKLISPRSIYIPGDLSSASFFLVLASILPNSRIVLENISLNPSRTGIIKVLKRMGARINVSSVKCQVSKFEPMGDILVKSSRLKGTIVKRKEIPSLIDELPILMVAACFAQGETLFKGVEELRVKETDRIRSMSQNLEKMGAIIKVKKSGSQEDIVIKGVEELRGAHVKSFSDHRTAMSMVVSALIAKGATRIDDISCIDKSFPGFLQILKTLLH